MCVVLKPVFFGTCLIFKTARENSTLLCFFFQLLYICIRNGICQQAYSPRLNIHQPSYKVRAFCDQQVLKPLPFLLNPLSLPSCPLASLRLPSEPLTHTKVCCLVPVFCPRAPLPLAQLHSVKTKQHKKSC